MNAAKTGLVVFGIVLLLAGATFALQGADYLGGSWMTGNPFWLYAGSVIAIVGILLLVASVWVSSGRKAPPSAPSGA